MKIAIALSRALKTIPLQPTDLAAVELAKHFASVIDHEEKITGGNFDRRVGQCLLEVLVELGMTPKARNSLVKGGATDGSNNADKLAEFRSRRERRAAHLDAASS